MSLEWSTGQSVSGQPPWMRGARERGGHDRESEEDLLLVPTKQGGERSCLLLPSELGWRLVNLLLPSELD